MSCNFMVCDLKAAVLRSELNQEKENGFQVLFLAKLSSHPPVQNALGQTLELDSQALAQQKNQCFLLSWLGIGVEGASFRLWLFHKGYVTWQSPKLGYVCLSLSSCLRMYWILKHPTLEFNALSKIWYCQHPSWMLGPLWADCITSKEAVHSNLESCYLILLAEFVLHDLSQFPYRACVLSPAHPAFFLSLFFFWLKSPLSLLHLLLLLMLTVLLLMWYCAIIWETNCTTKKPKRPQTCPYLTPLSGCLASFRPRSFITVLLLFWKSCSSCHLTLDRSKGSIDCPFSCSFPLV